MLPHLTSDSLLLTSTVILERRMDDRSSGGQLVEPPRLCNNKYSYPAIAGWWLHALHPHSGVWDLAQDSAIRAMPLTVLRRYRVPDSQLNSCQGLDPRLAPLLPATVPTQEQGWHYVHLTLCCPVAFLSSTSMVRDFPEVHSPPPPCLLCLTIPQEVSPSPKVSPSETLLSLGGRQWVCLCQLICYHRSQRPSGQN